MGTGGGRWRLALALVAAGAVIGVGVCVVSRDDGGPEATVRAFFTARRDGDCERLVDLIRTDDWSQDGRLERGDFVASCEEVVDAYGPELVDVEVDGDGDEVADVVVSVAIDGGPEVAAVRQHEGVVITDDETYESTAHAGTVVVREDDGWKLTTDHELFRIGPSPDEVYRSYYEARSDGDCAAAADLLTERAREEISGDGDRDGFVEHCEATTDADPDLARFGDPPTFELSTRDGQPTAVAGNPLGADEPRPSDSVILVADGSSWKFDHETPELAAEALDALVVAPPDDGYRSTLASHVFPHRAVPGIVFDQAAGSDDVEVRRLAGFARGVVVRYERELGTYIDVVLYEFDDEEGARTYGERLAEHLGARRDPDAPRPPVELPYSGIDVCGLDSAGCRLAGEVDALDVDGRYVVVVSAVDYGEGPGHEPPATQALDLVTTLLATQTANL